LNNKVRKKHHSGPSKDPLKHEIIQLLHSERHRSMSLKHLIKKLNKKFELTDIMKTLEKAETEGILNLSQNHVKLISKEPEHKREFQDDTIEGKIQFTRSGNAFVIAEDGGEDVRVAQKNLNRATNGDRVKVRLFRFDNDKRREGEIAEILERHSKNFVGAVHATSTVAFLVIDNRIAAFDIFIPIDKLNNAQHGDKAVAHIIDWPKDAKNPVGEIIEILGKTGSNDAEMKSILLENGFKLNFPKPVLKETEKISLEISEHEIASREDFRKKLTFTIDPVDAKDFDDAISFVDLGDDTYEIGIHIADVSHYAHVGSALDTEAAHRATSVYLVDRVLPMFPEKLSNEVCSLRPKEDKLCFSVIFTINKKGDVLNHHFAKTVIHSDKRYSYEEAQEILDKEKGLYYNELNTLNKLSKKLRENRFKNGSINFETTEVKFVLDEAGNPIKIIPKEHIQTNMLIEDFMLLANRTVAELVKKKKHDGKPIPFVYRVHDTPDPDKLKSLADLALVFGHKLDFSAPKRIAKSLNKLLDDVRGKPEQSMIETLAIRTMSKAIYTTQNIGHYGLAFDDYCHFTSPIRRYPDVLTHRILFNIINEKKNPAEKDLEEKCRHCTDQEIKAMDAERASQKFMQVKFIENKVGQTFAALISGVAEFGIFAEIIENKCEGLIRYEQMKDDFYVYEEKKHRAKGKSYGKVYQLGDKISIRVLRVNQSNRTIDFEMAE
jgi:ribonuclease R